MKSIEHPSTKIAPELAAALQQSAEAAEQQQQLSQVQLAIILEQQWFHLFVPKAYGGLELSLPEAVQLEEALAWADGSTGWTVTLCAGAGWFIGFLPPATAAIFFNSKNTCLAGSGKATGIATINDKGYTVTGQWDYATGANHATAFTANCIIEENGVLLKDAAGNPVIKPFIFLNHEVTIHKNWNRIGMIATGSNRFEVHQLQVSADRAFFIDASHAVLKQPVYQYPFLQLAETTLAVNSSGMAMRFLALSEKIGEAQKSDHLQWALANSLQHMEEARLQFYTILNDSWKACTASKDIPPAILEQVSIASKHLAVTSRKVVDEIYPYCGMQAANPDTEINRVWRNLHTATQHSLFTR